MRSRIYLILGPVLFTGLVFAAEVSKKKSAEELLKSVVSDIKPKAKKMSAHAENFGGKNQKLHNNQQEQIAKESLNMAITDEGIFQGVVADVISPFQTMLTNKKIELAKISQKNANYRWITLSDAAVLDADENIEQQSWASVDEASLLAKAQQIMLGYVNNFEKIEFVQLSPFSTSTAISDRKVDSSFPAAFNIQARLDIRGVIANQKKRQDRGVLNFRVEQDKATKKWKVSSLNVLSGETLVASIGSFKEQNVFVTTPANYLRKEAIRRGGYALAVNDINNDGYLDMIIGHMGPVEIFLGDANGALTKIANAKYGFRDETLVKSVVISDFDNDGKKDVLFVRFAPSEQKGNDIALYQNQGTTFKLSNSIKNRLPAYYAMPSAIADYNNDGLLDFYIGFPGAKDFTVMNKTNVGFEGLKELHPQGLFYNDGAFSFTEVTKEKLPLNANVNPYQKGYPETALVFPHTSQGIDYDLDGNMDIVVVDDKANLSPLYKNQGKGKFTQVAEKIGLTNYDFGMGFTAADFDNDGKLEFVYTNVNFLAAERMHNNLVNNFSNYSQLPGTFGIRMFKTNDGKNYSDITALSGVGSCGEGMGGVEAIDYNNDGNMDIYVVNGLWSGSSREQDLSSIFSRAYSTFNYDYQEVLGDSVGIEEANTSFMKILMGFSGDVESAITKKGARPSMAGYQRNCLFRNNGNGTFTEVGYLKGVDSIADGYIAGAADFNQDGKMDLVLRNADPGTDEYRFPSVQVFLNQSTLKAKSVQLAFKGTKSNHDGVGVIAEAMIGNKKYVRHLTANNGSIQPESILHFGLNKEDMIKKLTVRWPSGIVDQYSNVPVGRLVVEEGSSVMKKMALVK